MPSIVIPAHDEAASIGRLLTALSPLRHDTQVVVVCNGCTDDTAERARQAAPWANVIERAEASKPAALDAGDAVATSFPRAYLDADVDIDAASMRVLFEAVGPVPAVAATPTYDLSRSSRMVRSHYAIWTRMVANNTGIAGTNAMVVTQEGRGRFDAWPRIIGDDYFLDGVFAPHEKRRVPQATVLRGAPRGFMDCLSRKARIHQGNVDTLRAGLRERHAGGGLRGMLDVVRSEPRLVVHVPAHVVITVGTRVLRMIRRWRGTGQVWYRDRSRATT